MIYKLISPEFCHVLTQVILHSLWQSVIVVCLVRLAASLIRPSANARYVILLIGQATIFLSFLAMFGIIVNSTADTSLLETSSHLSVSRADTISTSMPTTAPYHFAQVPSRINFVPLRTRIAATYPVYVVYLYLFGVTLMSIRLLLGLFGGQRLVRTSLPITEASVLVSIGRAVKAMQFTYTPAIAYCNSVIVPSVVGVLRPTLLLPISIVAGISTKQLEVLVMHELAHIRRYDHVINLVQRILEALLFYNPAIWYLSRHIREERELCCDDLVTAAGEPSNRYAHSLMRVAELVAADPASNIALVSLAATGQRSNFHRRIMRLIRPNDEHSVRLKRTGAAIASTLLLLAFIAPVYTSTLIRTKPNSFTLLHRQIESDPTSVNTPINGNLTLLHSAAAHNTIEEVAYLLDKGANPNARQETGLTPLHYAVAAKRIDVVGILLDAGADLNAQNKSGRTPLHVALGMESLLTRGMGGFDEEMCAYLIDRGANLNIADNVGITPLHSAVLNRHNSIAEQMIAHGANVNLRGQQQRTPLHLAALTADRSMIEMLERHGADLNARDSRGWTVGETLVISSRIWTQSTLDQVISCAPLVISDLDHLDSCMAVILGKKDMVVRSLESDTSQVNAPLLKTMEGFRLLHWAAAVGRADICKALLDLGADPNCRTIDGRTPLHLAAALSESKPEVIAVLIGAGGDVNAIDRGQDTPLHSAAMRTNSEVIKQLIAAGAKVNAQDSGGGTPLFSLTVFDARQPDPAHITVASTLLDSGANPNLINVEGDTPLHIAVKGARADLVELLLAKHANPLIKNLAGRSAIDIGLSLPESQSRVLELLHRNSAIP
ncbi:MAG TPA: ankyrin repeat domain-containing protein [Tepidisphaeraceae bacterium]|nr:ankyrin repeat domain-containing protein [Tepidisphaeraceae bacterium]